MKLVLWILAFVFLALAAVGALVPVLPHYAVFAFVLRLLCQKLHTVSPLVLFDQAL